MGAYFDWEKMVDELKLDSDTVSRACQDAETEFPEDLMMRELHIVRMLRSAYEERRKTEAA